MKHRATSRLLNACFAILNITTKFWVTQNCGVIYKRNMAFIRASLRNFSSNSTNICANSKIPFLYQSYDSASKKPLLFSIQIAHVLMKRKITFLAHSEKVTKINICAALCAKVFQKGVENAVM